jgi:hypothetical protein
MDVLIAGSLLSLMICVGALLVEWRLLSPVQRSESASKPEQS